MAVQKHRIEFAHWDDRRVWKQHRSFDSVSAFGNSLIIRRKEYLPRQFFPARESSASAITLLSISNTRAAAPAARPTGNEFIVSPLLNRSFSSLNCFA